ncbi:MAG TPA: hypothetical protein VK846_07610, partial [Candidatus Limnocylindria bacterium]|nr:hypothetical protein [Candidatus Limnocylindria bacterium]
MSSSAAWSWHQFRRQYCHRARNVMEVKGYLLRCMRRLKTGVALVPRLIVVDAGANNADIKA